MAAAHHGRDRSGESAVIQHAGPIGPEECVDRAVSGRLRHADHFTLIVDAAGAVDCASQAAEVVHGTIAFPQHRMRRRAVGDRGWRQTCGGTQPRVAYRLAMVVDRERIRDSVALRYEWREHSLDLTARPPDYRLKAPDLKRCNRRATGIEGAIL